MINNIHYSHKLRSKKVLELLAEQDKIHFEEIRHFNLNKDLLMSIRGACSALSAGISAYASYAYKERHDREIIPDVAPVVINSKLLFNYLLQLNGQTPTYVKGLKVPVADVDSYLQVYIDERIESESFINELELRIMSLNKELHKVREDLNRCQLYSEKVKTELTHEISALRGETLFTFLGYSIHAH
jgi:hypothetical protein